MQDPHGILSKTAIKLNSVSVVKGYWNLSINTIKIIREILFLNHAFPKVSILIMAKHKIEIKGEEFDLNGEIPSPVLQTMGHIFSNLLYFFTQEKNVLYSIPFNRKKKY